MMASLFAGLIGRKAGVQQPCRGDGASHAVEHRCARSAGNVRTQSDMQSFFEGGLERKDGMGEIGIRQRTMRDSRLAGPNCLHVGRTEKIAVCQNTLTPEQPKTIEALGVRYAVASKDVGMFPVTFGTMSLDMTTALPGHRAEAFKRHVGTGRNETRPNGRLHQSLAISQTPINHPH